MQISGQEFTVSLSVLKIVSVLFTVLYPVPSSGSGPEWQKMGICEMNEGMNK